MNAIEVVVAFAIFVVNLSIHIIFIINPPNLSSRRCNHIAAVGTSVLLLLLLLSLLFFVLIWSPYACGI